jgi:hypothetical protein
MPIPAPVSTHTTALNCQVHRQPRYRVNLLLRAQPYSPGLRLGYRRTHTDWVRLALPAWHVFNNMQAIVISDHTTNDPAFTRAITHCKTTGLKREDLIIDAIAEINIGTISATSSRYWFRTIANSGSQVCITGSKRIFRTHTLQPLQRPVGIRGINDTDSTSGTNRNAIRMPSHRNHALRDSNAKVQRRKLERSHSSHLLLRRGSISHTPFHIHAR